jgi:hypothetical protein
MTANIDIDKFRSNWKKRQLKYSIRPQVDIINGVKKPNKDLLENIDLRIKDLSEVLELLFKIYKKNKNLYGDAFLAFVGNEVIREWPWKDFPLTSVKARPFLDNFNTGITKNELNNISKNLHYEHWTPISFFRDLFDNFDTLTKENFYYALTKYYKVVWLEKEESKPLNGQYRSTRPVDIYQKLKIEIIEKEYWNERSE